MKSLLLAAHCLTLHLFSRSDSVVTGAISNGRPELPDADRMVGLFLNTVPVRSEIAGCSWIEVADALFRQERDGHAHRRYPLSAIQQIVGDELSSAFNYVNLHVLEPLWQLRDFRVWEETNFALLVNVIATPSDGMYLRIDSDGRGISRSQAALIGATFVELLWRLAEHPDEAADFAFSPLAATPLPSPSRWSTSSACSNARSRRCRAAPRWPSRSNAGPIATSTMWRAAWPPAWSARAAAMRSEWR